jgi:hypothetical protein
MSERGVPKERRLFTRVSCDQTADLRHDDKVWECRVIDLSLNGVLLEPPGGLSLQSGEACWFTLRNMGSDGLVHADAIVVHVTPDRVGCKFLDVDADSIVHLREMILALAGTRERHGA